MSLKGLVVVLCLGFVVWSRPAQAEKVKTNQNTKLHSRAGEQSPVVLTVKPGQTLTLLAKDGRWLKVRVSGRTGWVTRSTVDIPQDEDEIARNTRRRPFVDGRSTKRGFGGEGGPDDRIGADAVGDGQDDKPSRGSKSKAGDDEDDVAVDDDEKPSKSGGSKSGGGGGGDEDDDEEGAVKQDTRVLAHVSKSTKVLNDADGDSDESFTAQPRTALYVEETKGKWTAVSNDEGDFGYVLTSQLDIDATAGPRARTIGLRGRLGVALVSQSVATPGGSSLLPDNYSASSSSVTVALGADVLYPYKKRYWVGGEFAYDFNKAVPGISYMGQTTSFSYHNFNLRALGGYDLQKKNGMLVFGRLGYHYDSFQVADVADFTKNTAKLPSQIIQGPTLGAALAIPRLTEKLALKVSLDALLVGGSVQQTKNLEAGRSLSPITG